MVAVMAKKEAKATLKVDTPEHRLLNKLSAFRGVSIEKLFKEPDVSEFFKHLLLAEMQKEETRLKGRK